MATSYPYTRNPSAVQVCEAARVPGTLFSLLSDCGYNDAKLRVQTGRIVDRKWEGVGDREAHVFCRWTENYRQPGCWECLRELTSDRGWQVVAINDPDAIEMWDLRRAFAERNNP